LLVCERVVMVMCCCWQRWHHSLWHLVAHDNWWEHSTCVKVIRD